LAVAVDATECRYPYPDMERMGMQFFGDWSIYTLDRLFYHGRKSYTLSSVVESFVFAHVDSIFGQFELGVRGDELCFELFDQPLEFAVAVVFQGLELDAVIRLVQSQEEALPSANGSGSPKAESFQFPLQLIEI